MKKPVAALCLLVVACAPKRVEVDEGEKPLPADTQPGQLAAARSSVNADMMSQLMQMQAAVATAKSTCDAIANKDVSLHEERALGNLRALDFIASKGALIGDSKPEVTKELARIGLSVARASARPSLPWTFGVVENETPGSFAGGGGYVFVTTGLVKKCANEAQLAGALAREIAHVVQKADVPQYLTSLQLICITSSAMRVEGYSPTGDVSDPAFAEANWKNIGRNINVKHDEAREAEADAFSVAMLRTAGYEPAEYETLLRTLGDEQRLTSFKSKRGTGATNGKKAPLPAALRF